jgi:hypothetical protein
MIYESTLTDNFDILSVIARTACPGKNHFQIIGRHLTGVFRTTVRGRAGFAGHLNRGISDSPQGRSRNGSVGNE